VLIVTHDLDEAVRLGDTVAVLRDGRLAQHAPAAALLARPADGFVAEFLGSDRALQRLALIPAVAMAGAAAGGAPLAAEASLRDALAAMLARGTDAVPLAGGGAISLSAVLDQARA
jgi:osmoprotectant transport system ATP-binding protein